jgi:hypothetical protein
MKWLRKLLLLTGILLVLAMTGCTGNIGNIEIDTTLTVDTSFNGSRVMTATIPASVYKNVFDSDVDGLEEVINKYTPGDMYCIADENDDGSARIEMHIDFASKNEYQKEIQTICSSNTSENAITPVIKFDYSRSVLKNGYTIEENFTSLDLFSWLSEALKTEYPALEKKEIDDIFTLGRTEVVFDGQTLEMDGYIQISNIESNAFDSLSVEATLNEDQSVDARITYTASNRVVVSLGEKLDTLMDELVPEGAEMSYQEDSSNRIYTLDFHAGSIEAYVAGINKALRTNNTVFEVTTEGDADSLAAKKSIRQYYDGSSFLDFTDDNIHMTYVLKVSSEYSVDSCTGTYGYLQDETASYSGDICEITMTVSSSEEVVTVLGFAVDIEEIDIQTNIYSDTQMTRTMTFKLSQDADALIGASIKERLDTAAALWPDEDQMVVENDVLISSVQYRITMNADSTDTLTAMTLSVLGESSNDTDNEMTDSVITGGTEKKKSPWKMRCSFEDTLNLSRFLTGSQINNGIHYQLTYPKYYHASFTENNTFDDAEIDGASVICSTYNKVLTVRSSAEKVNVEGVVIVGLWIASILILIVLAVLNLHHILFFIKNKTIDLTESGIFSSRRRGMLALAAVAVVCFVFMSIRLLLRIY